jgi:hypothetical protein
MGKLLRALEKAGLVKLEEQAQLEGQAFETAQAVEREPPVAPDPEPSGPVDERVSFDSIYAQNNVPASPFPAEKLLKLLDGLRAMDATTRRSAVLAMDAADEAWTIEDSVLDSERKVASLLAAKALVERQVAASDTATVKLLGDIEKRQQDSAAAIRKQIADLEALLQREVEKAANERAAANAAARETRSAGQREALRLDAEVERLSEIARVFAPSPPLIKPSN